MLLLQTPVFRIMHQQLKQWSPLHPTRVNVKQIYHLLQGHQSKRTDIEVLCEIIYAHGERWNAFCRYSHRNSVAAFQFFLYRANVLILNQIYLPYMVHFATLHRISIRYRKFDDNSLGMMMELQPLDLRGCSRYKVTIFEISCSLALPGHNIQGS